MVKRLVVSLLLSTACGQMVAGEVYKWVDDAGHTHYGSAPPESPKAKAMPVQLKNTEVSDEQRAEAEARAARQKASLGHVPMPQAPQTSQFTRNKSTPRGNSCKDQWKQYQDSSACFARYRSANGSVKPEAFKVCPEVKQPEYCDK